MNEKQKRRFRARVGIIHKKMTISCRSGDIFVTKSDPGKKNPKNMEKQKRRFRARVGEFGKKTTISCKSGHIFEAGAKTTIPYESGNSLTNFVKEWCDF